MEEGRSNPDSEDGSRWKLGVFYFNRNDKRLTLPKRKGSGWTINFANPYMIAIYVPLILLYIIYIIYMVKSR